MNKLIVLLYLGGIILFPHVSYSHSGESGSFLLSTFRPTTELTSITLLNKVSSGIEDKRLKIYSKKNYGNIARDIAVGGGEYVETLYKLGGYSEFISYENFLHVINKDFSQVFFSEAYYDDFLVVLDNRVNGVERNQ